MAHMKRFLMTIALVAQSAFSFAEVEVDEKKILSRVTSEVYTAAGTPSEITKRARSCMVDHLTNSSVTISDAGDPNPFIDRGAQSETVEASGQFFVEYDEEAGRVSANQNTAYRRMGLGYDVKSVITVEARQDRFRISHKGIQSLQKSTGYAKNTGYTPVRVQFGSGHKSAVKALEAVTVAVSECISQEPDSDDW